MSQVRAAMKTPWAMAVAVVILAAAILISSAQIALGERTLALSSGRFNFELDPGGQGEGQIIVINDGDEPIKVLVYTADQVVDESGNVEFVVPNRDDPTFLQQPSSWVRMRMPEEAKAFGNTPYLEMEPDDRVPVDFIMQPPANAAPGDHNVVMFFEMFDLPDDAGGAESQIAGRLGSRLRMRVRGEYVERLDVQPFVVPDFKFGSEVPFAFTLQNEGNIDQRVQSDIVLYDGNEVELARAEAVTATPVYAGTSKDIAGELLAETQPFGQHTVVLEVWQVDDDGEPLVDQPMTEERTVWILPWWVAIVAIVLVVLIVGRLVWGVAMRLARRNVSREEQPQEDTGSDRRSRRRSRREAP
jgi:hypothetical protein